MKNEKVNAGGIYPERYIDRRTINERAYIRQAGAAKPVITGTAAVFNSLSQDLGGFVEKIQPGAFAGSLSGDVRALFNHNPDYVLGRTRSGTLTLFEDDYGLRFEINPPDTQTGRDLQESIKRGDISGCSFGFRVIRDSWTTIEGGKSLRTLVEVELLDISIVTFPAYQATDAQVRNGGGLARLKPVNVSLTTKKKLLNYLENDGKRGKYDGTS